MNKIMVTILLDYTDDKTQSFEVNTNDVALIMMITRGTLRSSLAHRATAYDEQGNDICTYEKLYE